MARIIAVEGIDGVGKTTLVDRIAKEFPWITVFKEKREPRLFDQDRIRFEIYNNTRQDPDTKLIVLDRCWLSTLVYRPGECAQACYPFDSDYWQADCEDFEVLFISTPLEEIDELQGFSKDDRIRQELTYRHLLDDFEARGYLKHHTTIRKHAYNNLKTMILSENW